MLVNGQGHQWHVNSIKGNELELVYVNNRDKTVECAVFDLVNKVHHEVSGFKKYSDQTRYGRDWTLVGGIECGIIDKLYQAKISQSELVQVLNKEGFSLPEGSKIMKTHQGGYQIVDKVTGRETETWESLLFGYMLDNLFQ